MRCFTFQSAEVLDILLRDGQYFGDLSKVRCINNDYSADIEQLGGHCPVWVFCLDKGNDSKIYSYINGSVFERFRCEMSVDKEFISTLVMLELEVPDDTPMFTGITNNAWQCVKVVSYLRREWLCAAYRYSRRIHWYYTTIDVYCVCRRDALFPYGFQCHEKGENMENELVPCVINNTLFDSNLEISHLQIWDTESLILFVKRDGDDAFGEYILPYKRWVGLCDFNADERMAIENSIEQYENLLWDSARCEQKSRISALKDMTLG